MAYGSSTVGGGLGGAAAGATLGSVVPGIGTAIGAGVGGLLGAGGGLLEDIFGSGSGNKQRGTLRPNQQALQDSIINLIQSRLSGQGGLTPQSQNALNRFNTQTVPSLAERFTSLGAGSQGSSAFTGALGQAGSGLQQELAGLDMNSLLSLLGAALGQSSENIQEQQGPGFGESLGASALESLPLLLKIYQSNNAPASGTNGISAFKNPQVPTAGNFVSQAYGNTVGNSLKALGGGY